VVVIRLLLESRHAVPARCSPQQSCDVRYTGRHSKTACVNGVSGDAWVISSAALLAVGGVHLAVLTQEVLLFQAHLKLHQHLSHTGQRQRQGVDTTTEEAQMDAAMKAYGVRRDK
jgi:hypothetical protein